MQRIPREFFNHVALQVANFRLKVHIPNLAVVVDARLEALGLDKEQLVATEAGQNAYAQMYMQTYENLIKQQLEKIDDYVWNNPDWKNIWEDFAWYANVGDYGWIAFYQFFAEIGRLQQPSFERYRNMMLNGIWDMLQMDNVCVYSTKPLFIRRNEEGRMHSLDGPCILFQDGFKRYFINGREVPGWIIDNPETITSEKFFAEPNNDVRGAMMTVLGTEKFALMLDCELVSTDHANNETYELYRSKQADPTLGHLQYVKVVCPSTKTQHVLTVPGDIKTALEGVAWTFHQTPEEYVISQHT